jgi:hypothetical protein
MNAVVLIVLGLLLKAFPALSADDVITKVEKSASRKNSAGAQVSVDIDPFRPATQSKLKAISGSSFAADIVVTGVDPARPIDVYQFTLSFDPTVLRAVSIVSGGFLFGGGEVIILQKDVTSSDIKWAEGFIGLNSGASGSGILATVMFEVIGSGKSELGLSDVVLAGLGNDLTGKITSGIVTVKRPPRTK